MNTTATHLATNVIAWVEHEEIIVVSLMKKALTYIDNDIATITMLGIMGACTVGALVRLSQLSMYFNLISCCD